MEAGSKTAHGSAQATGRRGPSVADLLRNSRFELLPLDGIYEHSPWIAKRAAEQGPFSNIDALHSAMCSAVRDASEDEQLALIRAHPDLVGRAVLTSESQGEQASAGLLNLSPSEVALFDRYNAAVRYRAAENHGGEHPRHRDIIDIFATAAQEPQVLAAFHRCADESVFHSIPS